MPKNWTIVSLEKLGEDKYYAIGDGDHGQIKPSDYTDSGVPYIRVGDLDWGFFKEDKLVYISEDIHNKNLKSELLPGDILIAKTGATIGKCCIVPNNIKKANTTSSVGKVSINKDLTSSKWILYYFLSPDFFKLMWSHSHRTAQPGFNIIDIKNFPVPLPPLSEQNRIISKLDALFAQFEIIKSSMAAVPLLLKDFRQQVLTQAVTGKLTNCKVEEKRLGDFLIDVKYGTSMKSEYEIDGTPIFRIPNISDGEINDADLKFSKLDEKEYNQLKLVEGDVLIIRSNGSVSLVGRSAIIRKKHIGYSYAGYLIRLRCGLDLNSEFLNYTLKSDFLRTQIVNTSHSSSGVNNINSQEIKDLKIYWTKPKEQKEIVSRVESLFAKADAIEKQYESLKAKIDNLPQVLLHKAFKGELTEQLESDGDAEELLKEIEALKSTTGKTKKGGKVVKGYEEKEEVLKIVAEPKEELQPKVLKLKPTNTEIYKRTLLAAEIVYQLKDTNTLGHLKLQKMLYLCQEIGSMNLPMNFLKQAMGPYDNQLARSLDKQFVIKKWFEYQREAPLKYKPLENCGKHKEDFEKYFENEIEQINYLIKKFTKFTSNQIEAVATLYACWKEAIDKKEMITDKLIIRKFYQWSKEKEKFREENLFKALDWMRRNGVEPK